jgi:glyoxylase-like metal-dependent hydrolase (beta-lactamase superfamily II)
MDQVQLQQISAHVYARVGVTSASPLTNSFGANAGAVIGRDAVLIIDTLMSAAEGGQLLAAIREITDRPIRYVVNTHHHMDHTWGNCVFAATGATVIGHEYTRQALHEPANGLARAQRYRIPAENLVGTVIVPPSLTFRQDLRLDLGGVSVELDYPGPTHTAGSITARICEDDVLFSGDMLFTNYHVTMIDADVASWCQALRSLQSAAPRTIVPGHGPVSSVADLQSMEEYLRVFDVEATRLCTGKTAADADAIAQELSLRLPGPERAELSLIVAANLRVKYLPK